MNKESFKNILGVSTTPKRRKPKIRRRVGTITTPNTMATIDTPLPLKPEDMLLDNLFAHLQGNILKGHGREHTANIFVKFTGVPDEVKRWLRCYAANITSCKQQLKENELFKSKNVAGGIFATVNFSASGLKYIGKTITPLDPSFQRGMKGAHIGDPAPALWEPAFQGEIDAVFLLAFHDQAALEDAADKLRADLSSIAIVLTTEVGSALKNDNKDGIEHFGYVDGTSQPLFFEDELATFRENNSGITGFEPLAPLGLKQVLVADPFVPNAATLGVDAFGSYFVFRKLEQNVKGFKTAEKQLALTLGLHGEDVERAGAMLVGRFEDGTPVTLSDEAGLIASGTLNAFNYKNNYRGDGKTDVTGSKCPFHAHIRKVNPRDGSEASHIMARRGIPFGTREEGSFENTDLMPEGGVGLLFQSFQASIGNQFEFLQQTWANNPNFPSANAGLDPIIGESAAHTSTGPFPTKWGDAASNKVASFPQFVNLKGGEYFFAPSMLFFNSL
ncbi:MAG: Dyp-type peroxidase [Bacteroidetes bacterium]|nr:Dyp-type peroxidase [Bacteroidota bacterium]